MFGFDKEEEQKGASNTTGSPANIDEPSTTGVGGQDPAPVAVEDAHKEPSVEKEEVKESVATEDSKFPKHEGYRIVEILLNGMEIRDAQGNLTHVHAKLENGTEAHVPLTTFDDSNISLIPEQLFNIPGKGKENE